MGKRKKTEAPPSLVQRAHDVAVGLEWVSPKEFWTMTAGEFWWLYRAKMPTLPKPTVEGMADVRRMVKEAKAKEAAQNE
jgi:hypothetical protein